MSAWVDRYLNMAQLVAGWSKDPSTKVGAVIVSQRNRVLSVGYNGFPPGIADDGRLDDKATKLPLILHAELNAILNSGRDLTGATIYTTHAPCSQCAAAIIQSGIDAVVMPEQEARHLERYGNDGVAMLREGWVAVDVVVGVNW